ncbi:hypothetical protein MJ584_00420 [Klebsiella pneumoniae]|nr:hypothetical protein MJ584_00420 [Klebsiella pneumoniae]
MRNGKILGWAGGGAGWLTDWSGHGTGFRWCRLLGQNATVGAGEVLKWGSAVVHLKVQTLSELIHQKAEQYHPDHLIAPATK